VVTTTNIRELAGLLYREYEHDLTDTEKGLRSSKSEFRIRLSRSDNRSYEYVSVDVLAQGGVLEKRRIIEIGMTYSDREGQRDIAVNLKHGNYTMNGIAVSGTNENWVDALIHQVTDCVKAWKRQPIWARSWYLWLCGIFPAIGFGLMFVNLFPNFFNIALAKAVAFEFGFIASFPLLVLIRRLYPSVELLTGPHHSQTEVIFRGRLARFVTWLVSVFAPLGLGAILQFMK
jgi:hypothetical protein